MGGGLGRRSSACGMACATCLPAVAQWRRPMLGRNSAVVGAWYGLHDMPFHGCLLTWSFVGRMDTDGCVASCTGCVVYWLLASVVFLLGSGVSAEMTRLVGLYAVGAFDVGRGNAVVIQSKGPWLASIARVQRTISYFPHQPCYVLIFK